MLDYRDTIIKEAIDRCLEEMYQKSQPKASYYGYLEQLEKGLIDKDTKVFERHYLCKTQFDYILNKYIHAYKFNSDWEVNIDFLVENLKYGGRETVYKSLVEGGEKVRTSKKMQPIKDIIGEENAEKLFKYIDTVKRFYRFDQEEQVFSSNICLGCAPICNAETVKNYWKSQGINVDIDTTELTKEQYWEIDEYGFTL